ncbi:MAG: hypothetical protein V4538_17720 [Bacteroidota bacterium]
MSENFKKAYVHILSILFTALISAGIAFLQNILNTKGVHCGENLNPVDTGAIGSVVAGGKIALERFKNFKV